MKRIVPLFFLLFSAVSLCTACTTKLNIRFVNQAGEDLFFGATAFSEEMVSEMYSGTHIPQTEVTVSAFPGPETSVADERTEVSRETAAVETAAPHMPFAIEEILAFYKNAVKRVRAGEAGYGKKTWESTQVASITGIPAVDSFVNAELAKRATPEDEAEQLVYKKGTAEAMESFPDCTLTDAGKIVSASCEAKGENWLITIVMQDETTPESTENSMLGKITDIILFKREIEKNLNETLPQIKDYEYEIVYKGFSIT